MPVLHEYLPSSENEGYYIYAMHDGANVTYQVSAIARDVLDKVDGCDVGERLPNEVFYALHRLELIYTHRSGVSPPDSLADLPGQSRSAPNLSTAARTRFFEELLTSGELGESEREDIRSYVRKRDIGADSDLSPDLHSGWIPEQPDSEVYPGEVAKSFQDGDWGFVTVDGASLEEDVFFHIDELDRARLAVGMEVEVAFKENEEGHIVTHVRRLTDAVSRELDAPENESAEPKDHGVGSEHDGKVTAKDVSEGDFLKVKVDRISGRKGLSEKGFIHVYPRGKTATSYYHITNRGPAFPVDDWVNVKVLSVNKGYAEAQRIAPQKRVEAPRYAPP